MIVGSTGKIEGKIDCQTADIAGHVKDDLHAHELLVVRASSTISGKIFYKEIDIEDYKNKISHLIPKAKEIVENLEITWR